APPCLCLGVNPYGGYFTWIVVISLPSPRSETATMVADDAGRPCAAAVVIAWTLAPHHSSTALPRLVPERSGTSKVARTIASALAAMKALTADRIAPASGGGPARNTEVVANVICFLPAIGPQLGRLCCLGVCRRHHRGEAVGDGKPVPDVDQPDSGSEMGELRFREHRARRRIHVVRNAMTLLGDKGQAFGPGQRRALARGIDRCLVPGREQLQLLLRHVQLARVRRMHLQAESAAVDLRGAKLDELEDLRLQAALGHRLT